MLNKKLLILLLGVFLIRFASASYSIESNYTIYPFYNAYSSIGLGINQTNILSTAHCTGALCVGNKFTIMMFNNNSNRTGGVPQGAQINSIYINVTVVASTNGKFNITSNAGYNITNDIDFQNNISNLQTKGFQYFKDSTNVLTTKSYQINLSASAVSDWNNKSANGTFGIFLNNNVMPNDDSYNINSSNASRGAPFLIIQKTCAPPQNGSWIIITNCIVINETINLGNNPLILNGGNLTLINSSVRNIRFITKVSNSFIIQDSNSWRHLL